MQYCSWLPQAVPLYWIVSGCRGRHLTFRYGGSVKELEGLLMLMLFVPQVYIKNIEIAQPNQLWNFLPM